MNIEQITDGDTLVFKAHQEAILQKCCGCGLWHLFQVKRRDNGDLLMTISRLKGEPDPEDYDISTEIQKGA